MTARVVPMRPAQEPPVVDGLPPPHNLDAEAAVLGGIMFSGTGEDFDRVCDRLTPEAFYSEAHRQIWIAIQDLRDAGNPCDAKSVTIRLRESGRLHQVNTHDRASYVAEVLDVGCTPTRLMHYANTVAGKYRLREMIRECRRMASEAYFDVRDVDAFIEAGERRLAEIARGTAEEAIEDNLSILKRVVARIIEAANRGGRVTGLESGVESLDLMTNGLHSGQMTVIGARPGVGKTALACHIAERVARSGAGVLFFSIEMSREEIISRIVCARARVDSQRFERGALSASEWQRMNEVGAEIAKAPLWIDDTSGVSMPQIRGRAIRQMARAAERGTPLGLVIVDYLQKVRPSANIDRRLQVAEISDELTKLSRRLKIPVIALAQLNREVDKRGTSSRRPIKSDLREAGDIEQDASVIVLMHRDQDEERAAKEERRDPLTELVVVKNRNGREGLLRVGWEAQCTRFYDLPTYEAAE